MKKIYFYILFFLFILLTPIKVLADNELIKDVDNPIEILSEVENWNEIAQRQPTILFESNIFKIWYASYNGTNFRIIYGESSDLKTINSKKIININYDQSYDFHDPSIIKINNKYELYFAVSKNETNYKILKTVSDDGLNFENVPVEILNTSLPWNNKAVSAPFVFYENNKYYLFYTGWNGSEWKIGLSIANNGTDWIDCTNNPIIPNGSGPILNKQQDKYVLLFHSSNASNIESVETSDSLSCLSNWANRKLVLTRDKEYDSKLITDPNIIDLNNKTYLIYSGLSMANKWTLNIAKNQDQSLSKYIVFIPGFMTSWNKNGLIYNLNTSIYDWKILDFVKEYDGLLNTLKNENYMLDDNLFVFAYDWRKPLEELTEDLNIYLNEKILNINSNSEINIIGHSYGGLIGRIYTQKYPNNISKVISVGSPHKGTAQVYKAVQSGDVDSPNNFLNFAQNIVINLNRDLYKSDKEIVSTLFPSLLDIYPIYSFLYDEKNNLIDVNSLKIKNNTLKKYEDFSSISAKLFTFYSDSYEALFGYKIKKQSNLNNLFANYLDGEPIEPKYRSGDKNLVEISTNIGQNSAKITGDHEEIIYKKNSIKKILEKLQINVEDSQIIEGAKTVLNPSMIFLIKSPAEMEVNIGNKIYKEKDGVLFISNAITGTYTLKVKGLKFGKYTVLVGLFDKNANSYWLSFNGSIGQLTPTPQVDTYKIDFSSEGNIINPKIKNDYSYLFADLIQKIEILKEYIDPRMINLILAKINSARSYYSNKELIKLDNILFEIYDNTTQLRTTGKINIKNNIVEILKLIKKTYIKILKKEMQIKEKKLVINDNKFKNYEKSVKILSNQLKNKSNEIDLQKAVAKKLDNIVKVVKKKYVVNVKKLSIKVNNFFKNLKRKIN